MHIKKIRDEIAYKSTEHGSNHNSFPSAVLTRDGKMMVAFRQARDMRAQFGETRHVDSASRAVRISSDDNGSAWTLAPQVIYDDFVKGVQDPCLNLLKDDTLLATFFTWKIFEKESLPDPGERDIRYYDGKFVARPGGLYTLRSHDYGRTWEQPIPVGREPLALRGNAVELPDGTLLLPAYRYLPGSEVHIYKSTDRGASWAQQAILAHEYGVNETSLFLTASGKIVAFMRSDNFQRGNPKTAPLITSESRDGGVSWSAPVERNIHTPSPFHALQLHSGKVLLSYGYRFFPFGIRAILLDGECEEWERASETILREDGQDEDLGYTSAVQLENGDIWIFYYYYDDDGYRYIGATVCRETE